MLTLIKERVELLKTEQKRILKHAKRVMMLEQKRIAEWKRRGEEDARKIFIGEEPK